MCIGNWKRFALDKRREELLQPHQRQQHKAMPTSKRTYIFIDEYGTPSLNTSSEGVTPYFIYVAVCIESQHIERARDILMSVRKDFNQGSPLKANRIKNDKKGHLKRLQILRSFSGEFPHVVHALIVDKEKIKSPGLSYKKVFIKYFNKLLAKIYDSPQYSEIHIVLDKTGRPEFAEDLRRYMEKHIPQHDLFSNNTFDLKDDKEEEPLLQVSDFYAGCIGRIFCDIIPKEDAISLYNCLREYSFCECYPRDRTNYLCAKHTNDNNYDIELVNIAICSAEAYLESQNSSEIGREIVNYFLMENKFYPFKIISSHQIKDRLKLKGLLIGDPIVEISHLRSAGVLIVSPLGKNGYKLPCNIEEIKSFYDRISTNVIPQLKRAYILNRVISTGSVGKINVLQELGELNKLVNAVTSPLERHLI